MAKPRTVHRCTECGATAARWLGRCPECGEWGTVVEESAATAPARAAPLPPPGEVAMPLAEVDPEGAPVRPTRVDELDRVLGGGVVAGSVTLLGGEPGIGKSTLLLQALNRMADAGARCLLASAEESREQVRRRAGRLGTLAPGLFIVSDTSLPAVLAHAEAHGPDVLALDSIQAVHDPEQPGAPGSVTQVRECAHRLVRLAKERGVTTILVGHVTKEGTLAGPRTLEHVVDTVLSFDGERQHSLRLLHALKHRFGPTHELGVFEMGEDGLVDVPDASALFLADRRPGAPGSVVAPVLEGARPLLVEVQALVSSDAPVPPRRVGQGLDGNRLTLLLAVLKEHANVEAGKADVFASVAGGVRVSDPGLDLPVALAVASACRQAPIAPGIVAVGEVGLGGEIRQVGRAERRLAEAARLGFTRALAPPSTPPVRGIEVVGVADLSQALVAAGPRRQRHAA
ncbi:MAG TPA: DNA repair protein RadA [Acidimicrobiia bacterium]|nr:DNA repair protein RadA [Acidimicrobiia bacterium]